MILIAQNKMLEIAGCYDFDELWLAVTYICDGQTRLR